MPYHMSTMEQLREARIADDNWTGLSSAAERRKRQNRLHQRAWRRKKAAQRVVEDNHQSEEATEYGPHGPVKVSGLDGDNSIPEEVVDLLEIYPSPPLHILEQLKPFVYWEELYLRLNPLNAPDGVPRRLDSDSTQQHHPTSSFTGGPQGREGKAIPPLIPYLHGNLQPGATMPNFSFPLSADHRLLVLIQYNVLRATITNMSILSILHRMPLECGAVFNLKNFPHPPDTIPPSLEPTELQKRIDHDVYIDVFPWPSMRDNLLLNMGNFDEDELCVDVAGGLWEGFDKVEQTGLIVWGEPWSETGWEMSEGFATKWSFLLKGCHALVESTNRWRESRGEDKLVIDV
ncbi:hypothetical protein F5Y04DRAFT_222589 [Hypomontagnella monticulosa]|nr:hypothetical protein F5Y04DRAFT_222589 [Hypomontagnella monticulosa]